MPRFITSLLAITLVVPALVFFTDLTRNPYYFQIVLLNALAVALAVSYLARGLRQGSLTLRRTPADLPFLAFFAVASLSWLAMLAANTSEPWLRFGVYNEGLKRWLYLVTNMMIPYWAAVSCVDDENRPGLVRAVFITAWVASAYGILQYFGIELIWPKVLNPYGGRCVSTFGNPNFLSSYLVMVLPVALALWLAAKSAGRRVMLAAVTITCFMALLSTMTRSSWVGAMVALSAVAALALIFERRQTVARRKTLIGLCVVVCALTLWWPRSDVEGTTGTFVQRLTESAKATTTNYQSYDQRRLIWSCAWHMVKENPVLGKGWGCFELFYPFYQGRHLFLPAYHSFRTHANNAHNEVLEIWSQTGTAGMGVYLWLMLVLFVSAWSRIRTFTGEKRFLAIGLAAGAVGMLTDNLLNVSLHFAVPGYLYWWQWGLLMGMGALTVKTVPVRSTMAKALILILCLSGVFAIVRYYRNFMGEVHYFKGFKYSKTNDLQRAIMELEKAHRWQRLEVNNNYELSNCYARAGMREKALEYYAESLRANAGYDEIYYNMATVLAQMSDYPRSILEYTRALYINPLSEEAYTALGSIFLQQADRYARAGIALFEQSVYFYPRNKDTLNNLGYLYTRLDDHEKAVMWYRRALEIAPDFALARRNMAVSLSRLGRRDATLDEMDRLFAAVGTAIAARDWQAARTRAQKLVTLAPGNFTANLYLANICFTLGDYPAALAQYNAALALEPANSAALCNRGMVHMALGSPAAAKADFEQVLQVEPTNQAAREQLLRLK